MKVAYLCGTGKTKTQKVLANAKRIGIGWPVPTELDDDELERLIDPLDRALRCPPDFPGIARALDVETLKPRLARKAYDVYLDMVRKESERQGEFRTVKEPYAFSMFKGLMSKWNATAKLKPSMLVNWHAGEEAQADWAGKTLKLYGPDGLVAPAFLFVATLPYSDYTFVRASLDMGMLAWLEHHVHMFDYFGGVPLFLGIDNLATGITFHEDGTRTVNVRYQDLVDHYGTIVVPSRVKVPTDKASVEGHVRLSANAFISILEDMRFSSIDQLNEAIALLLDVFNDRPSAALASLSRREAFEAWEKNALQPLPAEPFAPVVWKKYVVSRDSVASVRGNYYSIPSGFEGQKVWARISRTRVDFYDIRKAQCLASYPRRMDGAETFDGLPGTCPDRFRPLLDWAEAHGRLFLLLQWDAERNEGLSPERIVCHSKKVVWWHCRKCGYTWQEAVVNRTERSFDDCPMCAGLVLIEGVNDLATTHPHIAAEWDNERNPIRAGQVFADWRQQVWWNGVCGHTWCAPVKQRTSSAVGALCPYCSGKKALPGFNDVATLAPELAAVWHPSRNRNVTPDSISVNSNRNVYLWDGAMSGTWRENPRSWLQRHGMQDLFAPFDDVIAHAKAQDESAGTMAYEAALPHGTTDPRSDPIRWGRLIIKWQLFNRLIGLTGMNLEIWCEQYSHPELLDQWDAERNTPLTPADVMHGDTRSVWWSDPACGHTWRETVASRTYAGSGCHYCTHFRILSGYSALDGTSARSVKNWPDDINEPITPATVSDRDNRSVWWHCPECGHEWRENLGTNGEVAHSCPVCSKRPFFLRPGENDLLYAHPRIAKMFAADLNEGVDIATIFAASKKRYWWRCEKGHTWKSRVDVMIRIKQYERCPYCTGHKVLAGFNDLETAAPEAAALWHPEKNGDLRPSMFTPNMHKRVWWMCPCGHEWEAGIRDVAERGTRCPLCANRTVVAGVNDLATINPAFASEWHPTRNGDLKPTDVAARSNKSVWWMCAEGHEWRQAINDRRRKNLGCPICGFRKLAPGINDLVTTHPHLAAQWAYDLNGDLKPNDVMRVSNKRVWWRCEQGHTWQLNIRNRAQHDVGCPYCHNRKVLPGFNDLATLRPDLAAQWYYEGNWPLKPEDVTPISIEKVWWRAECGHVFKLTVNQRAKNIYLTCPYCCGRKQVESPTHNHGSKATNTSKKPAPLALNAKPNPRLPWGRKVLDAFLDDPRQTICIELESRAQARVKRESLGKELRSEGNPYAARVKVKLRGTKVYLQKLE